MTSEERRIVTEDDILLWRMVVLYMVAEYSRRARNIPPTFTSLWNSRQAQRAMNQKLSASGIQKNGMI